MDSIAVLNAANIVGSQRLLAQSYKIKHERKCFGSIFVNSQLEVH